MRFAFATATRIVFGPGTLREVAPVAAELGTRALVVGGGTASRVAPLLDLLHDRGLVTTLFHVAGEPTTDSVVEGVRLARDAGCDLVVGMGGGSVLDTGKAIA